MHEVTWATRRAYDANARSYADETVGYDKFPGLLAELERFESEIAPGQWVLDLGAGAGRDTAHLHGRGIRVVAADVSLEMLRTTRRRCEHACAVQSDMTALPFRDASFAGAWACASFVHVHSGQLGGALCELYRVLAGGATIAASMKSGDTEGWSAGRSMAGQRWFNLMAPERFATMLSDCGFRDVRTRSCGRPDWYVATAVKLGQA
ncbi:class I SAM-dependent methyltransferase [Kibdelosporangium philippinense]|uniref:Class I SAM-dependent methyltransferase n=1 Tax=Kibdelosporangium philippinense TaxID=211113 RepID=A0ABS8ZM45_9PSEU|nr:class I SAM-dependent methyltransferase [Kibdelosporangium philippinense]MCE7008589.1 class I SAM-dependent methyltransferase [Kibdelosporangium philippinense]